jgi:hypothetical protein
VELFRFCAYLRRTGMLHLEALHARKASKKAGKIYLAEENRKPVFK